MGPLTYSKLHQAGPHHWCLTGGCLHRPDSPCYVSVLGVCVTVCLVLLDGFASCGGSAGLAGCDAVPGAEVSAFCWEVSGFHGRVSPLVFLACFPQAASSPLLVVLLGSLFLWLLVAPVLGGFPWCCGLLPLFLGSGFFVSRLGRHSSLEALLPVVARCAHPRLGCLSSRQVDRVRSAPLSQGHVFVGGDYVSQAGGRRALTATPIGTSRPPVSVG